MIEGFIEATGHLPSPRIFRQWCVITTIGLALQRRCWFVFEGRALYPNFYTVLVGKPASGKTRAITEARTLLSTLDDVTLTPSKVTKEKLVLKLAGAGRLIQGEAGPISATICGAFITELGTFLSSADPDFINILTDLFDCPKVWISETIKRGEERIENLFLSILGGTTPRGIAPLISGPMQGTGFISRLNLVCSTETKPPSLYAEVEDQGYVAALQEALRGVAALSGPFDIDQGCRREMQSWFDAGMPPRITNPRFDEYNARRHGHLLKLCMVYAASRGSLCITLDDFANAKQALLEAEEAMPLALQYAGSAATSEAILGIEHWMREEMEKTGTPIREAALKRRLLEDISPQHIAITITEMLQSGVLRAVYKGALREFVLG